MGQEIGHLQDFSIDAHLRPTPGSTNLRGSQILTTGHSNPMPISQQEETRREILHEAPKP